METVEKLLEKLVMTETYRILINASQIVLVQSLDGHVLEGPQHLLQLVPAYVAMESLYQQRLAMTLILRFLMDVMQTAS